ncbi:protein of unknown function DUF214 [Beutenbergia cavernae DSM 12333]|uniref:ABC3 transporter permease C-terminal domain-containing protein n=1 Tax=Beutenbergia cavernae (strain ATCC BAA-8 / DSM 12333 / CCUG 43141 / JCM 11478 / NBRC 16432 / NCIMB 13614 / HKI 0122) TaxID=471853 RepID=C5BX29_BEUC1|nr:FtsX-like permease family protein [Beutenbergia cavernae]ACQ78704.1 protein of unknown function DUF214 [Beutenbergia cavernae DSM 12333]
MRQTVSLWWMLRRRSAGRSDPQGLTAVLATIAFAVTTAVVLVVLGGVLAFQERAVGADEFSDAAVYPILAYVAAGLLVIPIVTLGAAAARLAMARRDARLAALRLAGATTSQVGLLTLLEAASQAVVGAVLGVVGYLALIPLVAQLRFQNRTFELAELWVGPGYVALAVLAVVVLALGSAALSLRRVAITPLGVAARVTPKGLSWLRVVPVVVAGGAWIALLNSPYAGIGILLAVLLVGFAILNVVGPFVVWLIGRVTTARARSAATLIAGRRILDSPKTAWRTVGGVSLATFIAGMASVMSVLTGADADVVTRDMATGGFLTLGIAGLLAAVSAGVMQSGRIIDQRAEYRTLALTGAGLGVMRSAQLREIVIPLLVGMGVAAGFSLMFLVPMLGFSAVTDPSVVLQFAVSVLAAFALVIAGVLASRRVLRTVLTQEA